MTLMPCLEYFLDRHVDRFQFLKTTAKTGNHLAVILAFSLVRRSHACHRSPMTGNHHGLPVFNSSKQFGKPGLGFCRLHLIHFFMTSYFDRLYFSKYCPCVNWTRAEDAVELPGLAP